MYFLIAMVAKAAIETSMTKPIQGASSSNLFTGMMTPQRVSLG